MKRYCSSCKQPLANPDNAICDKCGNRTEPIGYFERFETDNYLSEKDKNTVKFIGWFNVVGCLLLLFVNVVQYLNIRAELESLRYMWDIERIEQTAENLQYIREYSAYHLASAISLAVMAIDYAFTIFLGIMILLKKSWALRVARVLYVINAILNILALDIAGFIITMILASKLKKVLAKMHGGEEYNNMKYEADKKQVAQAAISADTSVWQCKSCAYINPNSASECKSCGKWK